MDGKDGIMMCKLKGRMDKGGHYDVEMKVWMQKWPLSCANSTGGYIRMGIMIWKSKGGWKRWYYDVQIKMGEFIREGIMM